MASNQYYLKDKTLDLIKIETVTIKGSTKKVYYEWKNGLYCYYRQIGGGVTIDNGALSVYDNKERAIFVINRLPELRQRGIATFLIRFEGRLYDVLQVDNYEGYTDDYKLTAQYNSSLNITTEPEPEPEETTTA